MRIAICDDKAEITMQMKEYLLSMRNMIESRMDISIFNAADDFLYEVENNASYDAVFMDIDLGELNGIDIAKRIYEKHPVTMIAFITGHRQYIHDVFDVQPCGFIEKPILKENVKKVFELIVKKCDELPKLCYNVGGSQKSIMLREIVYLKSDSRKIIVTGIKGNDVFYGKMDEVDEKLQRLSSNFVRISQSYIINAKYIKSISYTEVVLNDNGKNTTLSISQRYRAQVKKWYINQNIT